MSAPGVPPGPSGSSQAAVPAIPPPRVLPPSSTSTDSGGNSVRGEETKVASSPRSVPLTSIAAVDLQEGLPPRLDQLRASHMSQSRFLISEPSRPHITAPNNPTTTTPALTQQESKKTLNEVCGEHAFLAMLPSMPFPGWFRLRRPGVIRQIARMPRSFILLKVRGWVWFATLLYPQLLLGVAITFLAFYSATQHQRDDNKMGDLQKVHGLIGTILSFTIGFRTNSAYNHYYEGRRLVGALNRAVKEVVSETYSALNQALQRQTHTQGEGKASDDSSLKAMTEAAIEIRRKLNILLAFIRQDVRESVMGFIPGSKLETQDVLFDAKLNYHWDPCRPRLWDLLDKQELNMYSEIRTHNRPLLVVGEIKAMSAAYGRDFLPAGEAGGYAGSVKGLLNSMLDAHDAMTRIRDTPVPYPYIAVLNVTTFVFVYCTPFIYLRVGLAGTMVGTLLLALCYYGVSMIAVQLENPFGYDPFDLSLERYCLQAHDDTCMLARALADDETSFVPDYLSDRMPKELSPAVLATPQGVKANVSSQYMPPTRGSHQ